MLDGGIIMLKVKIDEDKLKSTTEEYFNAYYTNLSFSDDVTMNMEFSNCKLYNDRILLVAEVERTIRSEEDFNNNRFASRRIRLSDKKISEPVYLDYDYLKELGNNNGIDFKYLGSNIDGTDIKYQLSFVTKEMEGIQKIKK